MVLLWISHGSSGTKGQEHLVYTGITKPNTRNKKSWNWTVDPERNLNKLPGRIQEELTSFSSCPLFGTLILAKYCVNWNGKAACGTSYHPRFQWSTPLSSGFKRSNKLFKFAELWGLHLTFQQNVGLLGFLSYLGRFSGELG